jgi:hypothetical protein
MATPSGPMPEGGWLRPQTSPLIAAGLPLFDLFRVYGSVDPYGLIKEFRPDAMENFTEDIEGNTSIDVIISEEVAADIMSSEAWSGPYSLIISLVSNIMIHRVWDRNITEAGTRFSSYIYDSYYVKNIKQEPNSRNFRMECAGLKHYLSKRLAIPSARNTINGTVNIPDGSQETKPIPTSQMLRYNNQTPKSLIINLLNQTKNLQQIPVWHSPVPYSGSITRTYLMKDFLSIEEAIDNLLDDQVGPSQIVFDGGAGQRSSPSFVFHTDGYEKGHVYTSLSTRSDPLFRPNIQEVEFGVVNNIWTVGNASDGNMLVGHRVQSGSSGKILLQEVDTQRNDLRTSSNLLSYTDAILQRSGQSVRTCQLDTGLTQDMLMAFSGNYISIESPEEPQVNGSWTVVRRVIDMENKRIKFDLAEISLIDPEE